METASVIQVLGVLAALGGAIGAVTKGWTMLRGIVRKIEAIDQTAARLEQVADDVKKITEKELSPNGGSSLKDAVTRIERRQEDMEDRQQRTTAIVEKLLSRLLTQGDRIDEIEEQRHQREKL